MCLVLKLDNGKGVSIAKDETEPTSTVLVMVYIFVTHIEALTGTCSDSLTRYQLFMHTAPKVVFL